mmetsp:Transcript_28018/g.43569  ORF Transcript_28018/g.43569 Transcript_28018/m.43569 type:complete len:721 (-) Transcript_28018:139-2301(-)|eukprot:CAMPEP_0196810144 /NCGR_PEP_ID=MMETSP1362-20130617/9975_1 /TAXON_ID=163516 /ORGANISM="Leptocylindrus danicus, Strain CCMP1856" /LENGTH=720 /DNA_ID=CAMNT_0042185031 /DNA_START=86 /DNA_END=2248 /DNA_ORIENTATION=+
MSLLLLPFKLLLLALDFTVFALTFGWVGLLKKLLAGKPMRSVPVGDDPSHRVSPEFKDGLLVSPDPENIHTLYDISKISFEKYANQKCMGTREFLGQKSAKVKEFGPNLKWRTFKEVGNEAMKFGAALRANGLVPAPKETTLAKLSTPCAFAIFENTCAEWMIAAQGCFSQSIIVTTIYATLGMDAVIDAVNDGIISAILCNKTNVKVLVSRIKEMKSLKTIIYTNDFVAPGADIEIPDARGVKIVSFEDFVASGSTDEYPPTPPAAETCAVIMYTSGSTGKPKGVVLTHANVVSSVAAGHVALKIKEGEDFYLGYLPLAHILELMAEFCMLSLGCAIGYGCPKTLTTSGSYPIGAIDEFKPTLMAAVPKIWDIIKKAIEGKIAKESPVIQFLFKTGFDARAFAIAHGYDTPLFHKILFKKMEAVLGGRMRLALSGGGPLNSEVQEFVRTNFGMPLIQGYGLTETCAGLTIQDPDDLRFGVAGKLIGCVEVKLLSCPEIKDKAGVAYLSTDTRDVEGNKVFGRGEILVKGNNIAVGYYGEPEKTKEVFREDGFFHTGDIGQFMDDGSIRIVDRAKNLVKLKGGEYIAVENMEMVYGNSKFVNAIDGGICCYGDGDMDRPIALMQIAEATVMEWAEENGVEGDFAAVKASKEFNDAVMEDMLIEWKKAGLSNLEKLVAVAYLTTPWTPENGCLTAANKLQRRAVISMFEKEFNETRPKGMF